MSVWKGWFVFFVALARRLRDALFAHAPPRFTFSRRGTDHGLAVLLHGLMGSPMEMRAFYLMLYRDYDIMCPRLPRRGNCSLQKASREITAAVQQYFRIYPHRRSLILIGNSNGGRIAAQIAIALSSQDVDITLITVGTPFYGTTLLDYAPVRFAMRLRGCCQEIIDELRPRSRCNNQLVSQLLNCNLRCRMFFEALNDMKVIPPKKRSDRFLSSVFNLPDDCHLSAPYAVADNLKNVLRYLAH